MRLYFGIDLHANNYVHSILDESDRVVLERRVANDIAPIISTPSLPREDLAGCVVKTTYFANLTLTTERAVKSGIINRISTSYADRGRRP